MQRTVSLFPIFLVFLVLSFFVFFLNQKGYLNRVNGFFEQVTAPVQRLTFGLFQKDGNKTNVEKLKEENARLLTQLAKQNEIEKENKALHDQFVTENPSPQKLLPAQIIGRNGEEIILDKGEKDEIKNGQTVVYKNNLLGRVSHASQHRAVVTLVTSYKISFTAQTSKTESLGVVNGKAGDSIFLENVVLSDKLEKGDLVVTKGDINSEGKGFPPDLIVGKIVSVYKKASALFQTAEVRSLVDFEKLNIVFVITSN